MRKAFITIKTPTGNLKRLDMETRRYLGSNGNNISHDRRVI